MVPKFFFYPLYLISFRRYELTVLADRRQVYLRTQTFLLLFFHRYYRGTHHRIIASKMSQSSKKLTRSVADCARAVKEVTEEVQELLLQEKNDSEERARTMIIGILAETKASLEHLTKQSKLAIAIELGLKEKIEKKKIDIQRHTKLFASLNCGNPTPNQKEYEQIEEVLIAEYER